MLCTLGYGSHFILSSPFKILSVSVLPTVFAGHQRGQQGPGSHSIFTDVGAAHVPASLATDATLTELIRRRSVRLELKLDGLAVAGSVKRSIE